MKTLTADEIIEAYNIWGIRYGFTDTGLEAAAATLKESHPKLAEKFEIELQKRQEER